MRLCTPSQIRKLTGTKIPGEQIAALRQRGLNPFVCPTTGSPIIDESVILKSMMGNSHESMQAFVLNEEAFK